MIRKILLALIFCTVGAALAMAEVADSSAGGFTVKTTFTIQASPDEVYRRLIHIGDWWDSAHTYSGDAHNMTIAKRRLADVSAKSLPAGAACGIWKYSTSRREKRCGWAAVWGRCRALHPTAV